MADELADPHEKRGAGDERRDHEKCPRHERIEQDHVGGLGGGTDEGRPVALAKNECEARTLQQCDADCHVTGPLCDLALADRTHLLPFLQFRNDDIEHLHDDARGDVGHDAEREDRERSERPAGEQVQEPECTLGIRGLTQLRDSVRIDTGNADGRTEAVDHDHHHREEELLAKVFHFEDVLHV